MTMTDTPRREDGTAEIIASTRVGDVVVLTMHAEPYGWFTAALGPSQSEAVTVLEWYNSHRLAVDAHAVYAMRAERVAPATTLTMLDETED